MGIAAVILGVKGLRRVREHPDGKGSVRAWVGIGCGGSWSLLGLAIQVAVIAAIVSR